MHSTSSNVATSNATAFFTSYLGTQDDVGGRDGSPEFPQQRTRRWSVDERRIGIHGT